MKIRLTKALTDKFWAKVQKASEDACWLWLGNTIHGYGSFYYEGRVFVASRMAFYLGVGIWPPNIRDVCHTCDNPPCCNPGHLFLGTEKMNSEDCVLKDRMPWGDRHYKSKLSNDIVVDLREDYSKLAIGEKSKFYFSRAERLGVCVDTIRFAIYGLTYKKLGN